MFWIIVIAIIVLVVLWKMGVFRKPDECKHCGKTIKGTEQQVFWYGDFCLCKECASKIHPQIMKYAKENWNYTDYTDCLAWEDATKEERAKFNPDVKYGHECQIAVDTERGLFSIGTEATGGGMVLRFADLTDYELNFKPEEVKEGLLGDKVSGNEFITVDLSAPRVYLEEVISYGVKLRLRKKGFLSTKYEYELPDDFLEAIRAFTICVYIEAQRREGTYNQENQNIGEIERALALFMYDSMDEVTEASLKQQRNALIKAFHPDNNESNEAYSQKINAAYELLSGMIKK